jgi:hypothetical protein
MASPFSTSAMLSDSLQVGYPGLRFSVTEDEQQTHAPKPVGGFAYDEAMLTMTGVPHGNRP